VQLQRDLINAWSNLLAVVFNTPALAQTPESDLDKATSFFDVLLAAVSEDGPGSTSIDASEKALLLAAPLPAPVTGSTVNSMVANWNDWVDTGAPVPAAQSQAAAAAGQQLKTLTDAGIAAGWRNTMEVILRMNDVAVASMDAIVAAYGLRPETPLY
jgi:hypothetical protein